jgi:hypothetical protein
MVDEGPHLTREERRQRQKRLFWDRIPFLGRIPFSPFSSSFFVVQPESGRAGHLDGPRSRQSHT